MQSRARLLCFGLISAFAITGAVPGQVTVTNDTNGYDYGNYFMSVWTRNFDYRRGSFTRRWFGNGRNDVSLFVFVEHLPSDDYVGFDSGVSRRIVSGTRVINLSRHDERRRSSKIDRGVGYRFTSRLEPYSGGYWWMGPKTLITNVPRYPGNLNNQYECYIVESSNLTPQRLARRLGLIYHSETRHNGAVYQHYTYRLGAINQVWSIRQSYRSRGWVSTNWIQRHWYLNDLVPARYYNLGWKMNVETAGAMRRGSNCRFTDLDLPWN